jgi:hypothetical protein
VKGGVHAGLRFRPSSGLVRLIAKARDVPKFRQLLYAKYEQLKESKQRQQEGETNLHNYKKSGLKERMIILINSGLNTLQILDDFRTFRENVTQIYQKYEEDINICARIFKKLPD